MNNSTNSSWNCDTPSEIKSFGVYFQCYKYFLKKNLVIATLQLTLVVLTILANVTVVCKINIKKTANKTIYDKIIIYLCLSHALTAIVDMPFFHVEDVFDYWPFAEYSALVWASYDNNRNTLIAMLMFYMTYARYRSIKSPFNYANEFALKHAYIIMSSFWIIGLVVWALLVVLFRTIPYTTHIHYAPHYSQFLINFFLWFLPLFGIYALGTYLVVLLEQLEKKKVNNGLQKSAKSFFKVIFDAKSKFTFIILVFLIQWTAPCIYILFEITWKVYNQELTLALKWSTYTASLSDALFIFVFFLSVKSTSKGQR